MKLIMRADDLGFSEAVNYGIEKTVREGVVTSVGMMTNMEYAEHGYKLLCDCNIALGQHTNICVGRPLSDPKVISSLVQENGEFCTSREIRMRKEDTVVIEEAEIEIEAQLQNVAKKHNLFFDNPGIDKEWEKKNGMVGLPFAQLDDKGLYNPEIFLTENYHIIKNNPCTVAVFHPGFLDQYILTHSSFTLIRPMECDFLCGEWVKNWIKENKIELVDFKSYR